MSRLFWMLLAGVRRGSRYLRSVLRAIAGVWARAAMAPGSSSSVSLEGLPMWVQGTAVPRPGTGGTVSALTQSADMPAHMVAWLVALGRFPGCAETDLIKDIEAAPAADLNGPWRAVLDSVRNAEACPGIPMELPREIFDDLTAEPEMAPPVSMATALGSLLQDLAGFGAGADAAPGAASVTNRISISAGTALGGSTEVVYTALDTRAVLTAAMTALIRPEWAEETVLYVKQAYRTNWDGNTLVLN